MAPSLDYPCRVRQVYRRNVPLARPAPMGRTGGIAHPPAAPPLVICWPVVAGSALVSLVFVGALVAAVCLSSRPSALASEPALPRTTEPPPIAAPQPVPLSPTSPTSPTSPVPASNTGGPPGEARLSRLVAAAIARMDPPLPSAVLPADPPAVLSDPPPAGHRHGTRVLFLPSPSAAAEQARRQDKLLFLLHVSGNFDDERFT